MLWTTTVMLGNYQIGRSSVTAYMEDSVHADKHFG
jgi:hypothetical protein